MNGFHLVAAQALVAIALAGPVAAQTNQLEPANPVSAEDSAPVAGSTAPAASPNPQAQTWKTYSLSGLAQASTQVRDCQCDDCKCLDELICKNGACKKNYAVFLTAKWCPACKRMYPIIRSLRDQGYIVFVLDVDEFPEASEQANARLLPTMIIIDQGKETQRFVGVTDIEEIKQHLKTKSEQSKLDEGGDKDKDEEDTYNVG